MPVFTAAAIAISAAVATTTAATVAAAVVATSVAVATVAAVVSVVGIATGSETLLDIGKYMGYAGLAGGLAGAAAGGLAGYAAAVQKAGWGALNGVMGEGAAVVAETGTIAGAAAGETVAGTLATEAAGYTAPAWASQPLITSGQAIGPAAAALPGATAPAGAASTFEAAVNAGTTLSGRPYGAAAAIPVAPVAPSVGNVPNAGQGLLNRPEIPSLYTPPARVPNLPKIQPGGLMNSPRNLPLPSPSLVEPLLPFGLYGTQGHPVQPKTGFEPFHVPAPFPESTLRDLYEKLLHGGQYRI